MSDREKCMACNGSGIVASSPPEGHATAAPPGETYQTLDAIENDAGMSVISSANKGVLLVNEKHYERLRATVVQLMERNAQLHHELTRRGTP